VAPERPDQNGQAGPGVAGGAGGARTAIAEARTVFCRYLYLPDPNLVDVVLAVPAGNKLLETDSLWLFLKGPPGSGKTEMVTPFLDLPDWALLVSNLTPSSLISGYVDANAADHSLLPRLNGKTLALKDFTVVLSKNDAERDEIFSILRDCYDGYASKVFGTGRREYRSRFNLVAGVTGAIESAWHLSQLGERFLCWGMAVDHREQARRAMANANREPEMRRELAKATADVLAGLSDQVPVVPEALRERTLTLAYLLARLRTYVARDRNDVVHRAPDVEVPTRIIKQLLRLGQSLAQVRHKAEVTEDEFAILRKVALDSMPAARQTIFRNLVEAKVTTAKQTAQVCRVSESVARRHLDDLVLLGLGKSRDADNRKVEYLLTKEARQEWLMIHQP
jgi:hypothetical protein